MRASSTNTDAKANHISQESHVDIQGNIMAQQGDGLRRAMRSKTKIFRVPVFQRQMLLCMKHKSCSSARFTNTNCFAFET